MDDDDDLFARDLAAAAPTPVVYAAAATSALSGVVLVFLAVQTRALLGTMTLIGEFATVGMFVGGVTLAVLSTQLLRMRLWAAVCGTAMAAVLAFASIAWLLLSVRSGLFSALASLSPIACVASAVTSMLSVPPCKRARVARLRMRDRGDS